MASTSTSVACYKCNKHGHLPTVCTMVFRPCYICNSITHRRVNCHYNKICKKCNTKHYITLPCYLPECKRCKLVTHTTELCSEQQCFKCNQFTHTSEECIQCFTCNAWGHKVVHCPTRVVTKTTETTAPKVYIFYVDK